jgi:hypothetical protein
MTQEGQSKKETVAETLKGCGFMLAALFMPVLMIGWLWLVVKFVKWAWNS